MTIGALLNSKMKFTLVNIRTILLITLFLSGCSKSVDYKEGEQILFTDIVNEYGYRKAIAFLVKVSNKENRIDFDGKSRLAQVLENGREFEDGTYSDMLGLTYVGEELQAYTLCVQTLPSGWHIVSVKIEGEVVTLNCVKEGISKEIKISWLKNTHPTSGILNLEPRH